MTEWIVTLCILILIVIALRAVLKGKMSLRLQYALWGLVLLRLLVPVTFGHTGISATNLADTRPVQVVESIGATSIPARSFESAYDEVVREYTRQGVDVSALEGSELEALDYEAYERMKSPWTVGDILMAVWLAGVAVIGLWLLLANLHFGAKLRRSRRAFSVEDCPRAVYLSAAVDTPCLFGLFRPAIYVTPETVQDPAQLRHTVQHELTHLRHGDHIWAILRGVCLALHWYNPLVWWAAALSRRDAELACDEGTLTRLGEEERSAYGCTLIAMTCRKRGSLLLTATTMNLSAHSLKERITLIAQKPKMAIYTLVAVVLVAAIAVGCTFTGSSEPSTDQDEPISDDTPYVVAVGSPSTTPVTTIPGLTLTVDPANYESDDPKIAYSLENATDTEYSFGPSSISIEALQDGEWHQLAARTDLDNITFSDIAVMLPPGSTYTGAKTFFAHGDYVPAGTYRLVIGLYAQDDANVSEPLYMAAEFTVGGDGQPLADRPLETVLAELNQDSRFFASYNPTGLFSEQIFQGLSGVYAYGKSTLYGNTLLLEYMPEQQTEILSIFRQLDPAQFVAISEEERQAITDYSGQFVGYITNTDGTSYRIDAYPHGERVTLLVCDYRSGSEQFFYDGPNDAALLDPLFDMFEECRVSNAILDDTARILLAGENTEKTLLRYQNATLVNLVDGITQKAALSASEIAEAAYDVTVTISGDAYRVDTTIGQVSFNGQVYRLSASQLQRLTDLLSQAK